MGFFTDFVDWISGRKFGSETEKAIKQISEWKLRRLSYDCDTFYPESGEWVELERIPVPERKHLSVLRRTQESHYGKTMIAEQAKQIYENIKKEIQNFQSGVQKFKMMNTEIKKDSLFAEIDHLFATRIKMLYNELLFCRFADLGEQTYYNRIVTIIDNIYNDMQTLNTSFMDYMYALSRTEYENNRQDLEKIRITVEAMSQAAQTLM